MAVELTSCKIYANLTAGWTDITDDAIGTLRASWGMSGTTPTDRIAETGTMNFSLNNSAGYYTPGGASVRAGWKKGIEIKAEMVYDQDTYIRFRGVIDAIEFEVRRSTLIFAHVTVVDWMNYAATHPMVTPALMTDATADQAISTIVAGMPNHPQQTSYETGVNTFPVVFDVTRTVGVAYTEFSRIVNSELGYLYLTKDAGKGETLVFENLQHRNGLHSIATIPFASTSYLLLETGDKMLLETGDKIYLNINITDSPPINTEVIKLGITHGDNLTNRIFMKVYPRRIDAAAVTLYQLGDVINIGSGDTLEFRANYNDPSGGADVGGLEMIVPVATTDYTLNDTEDGSGVDLTADAIVTVTFGANGADVSILNTSVDNAYLTMFKLRGKGIYTYSTGGYVAEDIPSILQYGYLEQNIDQKYQSNVVWSKPIADSQVYIDRYPRTVLRSIRYCANRSSNTMMAFLNYDIGDLVVITDSAMGTTGGYFIQGISFEVVDLGIVWVTYNLVEHYSLLTENMTSLSIAFSASSKDAINFGYLPGVILTSARTFAAWVYYTGADDAVNYTILAGPHSDGGGLYIYLKNRIAYIYTSMFDTAPGAWFCAGAVTANAWQHIAITYNCWDVDALPIIYINGSSSAVTESLNPAGDLYSQVGAEVVIGNWHTASIEYTKPFQGSLKDVRIYNRILTAAEITTLYNAGTPDASLVTTGLVFQGPVVMTKDATTYNGATLTADMKVLDNIYRAVGSPIDTPVATTWS